MGEQASFTQADPEKEGGGSGVIWVTTAPLQPSGCFKDMPG